MWFLQDGAPAHNGGRVVLYLNEEFPQRWIGTNSPNIPYPARSPDLNPLDFFYWGHLKRLILEKQHENEIELREAIIAASAEITPQQIANSMTEFRNRLWYCSAETGRHFEQLL